MMGLRIGLRNSAVALTFLVGTSSTALAQFFEGKEVASSCKLILDRINQPLEKYLLALDRLNASEARTHRLQAVSSTKEVLARLQARLKLTDNQFSIDDLRQIEDLVARMKRVQNPELSRLADALNNMKIDHINRTGMPRRKELVYPPHVSRDPYFERKIGGLDYRMQYKLVEEIIPAILSGQKQGSLKVQFPRRVLFAEFTGPGGQYRMAYTKEGQGIRLIAVGAHENFYHDVRKYVNSNYAAKP